ADLLAELGLRHALREPQHTDRLADDGIHLAGALLLTHSPRLPTNRTTFRCGLRRPHVAGVPLSARSRAMMMCAAGAALRIDARLRSPAKRSRSESETAPMPERAINGGRPANSKF